MLEKMKALAKEKDMCVLATVSAGNPHCSLMAYITDEECREIYMVTHRGTNKYKNLMENSSVSLLIDTREEVVGRSRSQIRALTVKGVFQPIESKEEKDFIRSRLVERHPHIRDLASHLDAEVLCVRIESFLLLEGVSDAHFERLT